jgi:hypothetical protein
MSEGKYGAGKGILQSLGEKQKAISERRTNL